MKQDIQLHIASSSLFCAILKEFSMDELSRAKRIYLFCKVALERRRREVEEKRKNNLDTTKLERMIARLESSKEAHRKLIDRLESG